MSSRRLFQHAGILNDVHLWAEFVAIANQARTVPPSQFAPNQIDYLPNCPMPVVGRYSARGTWQCVILGQQTRFALIISPLNKSAYEARIKRLLEAEQRFEKHLDQEDHDG